MGRTFAQRVLVAEATEGDGARRLPDEVEESAGEEMVGRLQSAAEAEAAATGTMAQRVLVAGATEEDRAKGDCRTGSKKNRSPEGGWSQVRRTKLWRGDRRRR